jgi:hypothetical protein
MIDYKYPTIASGAIPIGSVGRTRRCFFMNNEAEKTKEDFESIITTIRREFISIKVE